MFEYKDEKRETGKKGGLFEKGPWWKIYMNRRFHKSRSDLTQWFWLDTLNHLDSNIERNKRKNERAFTIVTYTITDAKKCCLVMIIRLDFEERISQM